MKITLGQKVGVRTTGNAARGGSRNFEATISKVGKKYFEIEADGEYIRNVRFHLDSGKEATEYSPNYVVYESMEALLLESEALQTFDFLKREYFDFYNKHKFSLDTLNKVKSILSNEILQEAPHL